MTLKLGKLPARPDAVRLKLATYLDTTALPKPPTNFGHERLVTQWGMLANNDWGCCVISGGLHESMLWAREGGRTIRVDDACAIRNYSAITGFDPNAGPPGQNDTDQGTDMQVAASYRRKTGLIDADGQRHKIGAYVALQPGNLTELWYSTYLFDGVGIGVQFPAQWMDAFNNGRPWGRVSRPRMVGGHYVPSMAKRSRNAVAVTWGSTVPITAAGYSQFNDETYAYLSEEKLINGKSLEGFDLATLRTDLTVVTSA